MARRVAQTHTQRLRAQLLSWNLWPTDATHRMHVSVHAQRFLLSGTLVVVVLALDLVLVTVVSASALPKP